MQVYLVPTVFGIFVYDSSGKIVLQYVTYPDTKLADMITSKIVEKNMVDPLQDLLYQVHSKGIETVVVEDQHVARAIEGTGTVAVTSDRESREIKMFRSMLDDTLVKEGIVEDQSRASKFRHDVAIRIARRRISEASKSPDLLVKHAIDAISEIDKNINILSMRLREWFSMFKPSLTKLVEDHRQFAQVIKIVNDGGPTKEALLEAGITETVAEKIITSFETDMGAPLTSEDLIPLTQLSDMVNQLIETREKMEEYVGRLMQTVAPNITALVGPLVGARLISMAGSLLDLSRKTSSTIQVLGAEKALFRSLKTGTAPPKHGLIFQVPELYSAPYWQRGKIARALAGKISIAAKIDAFSGRDAGQMLREAFEKRVKEIRTQNPNPPPPKPPASIQGRQGRQRSGRSRRGKYGKRRPRKR
ncbi:MAG: NOP5/NOP56 family protein [Candidatus Thorarchaeota archaeon]